MKNWNDLMKAARPAPLPPVNPVIGGTRWLSADLSRLPEWMHSHKLATIPEARFEDAEEDDAYESEHVPTDRIQDAEIILSTDALGRHRPVLDIDFPVHVVPSSTPGHYHLYLDKPLPWPRYRRLLEALADAGIIEPGYARVSIARRYTSVRLPWIRKDTTK